MADGGILTAAESASIRREYRGATLLPRRAYQDATIFEWERANIVRHDWVMVAREEDVAEPGSYLLVEVDGDPLIVVRARDRVLRAFHNVCRHRGTAVVEEPCGKVVRFQCPYHAWIPPGPEQPLLDRVACELRVAEDEAGRAVQPHDGRAGKLGEGLMIALPRPFHESSLVHGRLWCRHGHAGRASQGMASASGERFLRRPTVADRSALTRR